ncbi:MAG: ferrous iron transport protein B [Thermoplasmata archaeon]|nr:ferrous iron transport protein B [Thermoplasmata archaeon]
MVGQPNVGKSSLLNALVGPTVTVSNYPGTTVEITKARKRIDSVEIEFVDTPGIYSISDRSEEEKVTEKALFEEEVDRAIIIADAAALRRSLYLVLQILEAEITATVALNFVEEAEKKGIAIDTEKLGRFLNVPVVPINPLTMEGIDTLVDSLLEIRAEGFRVEYDDHIEKGIEQISSELKEERLPNRFIAIRILEEDEHFYKYLKDEGIIHEVKRSLEEHPETAEDTSKIRYGVASFIAERVTQIVPVEEESKERVDRVLLHRVWGPVITILFLLFIFGVLLYLGSLIQGVLMDLTDSLLSYLSMEEQSVVTVILAHGLTGVAAGVSIALPYVFLFYFLLGLLEDVGLLSRFVLNAESSLRKLGLHGKSFIPLTLGLGCTAPATRATRILSSKKEQFHCASLLACVPCSSRIAIIMGIVGFYGGMGLAFSVLATLLLAGLIWALAVKRVVRTKREPFLLELPPYRRPLLGNVLAKSWIRMKDFVYLVIPLLAIGGMVYGILDISNLTDTVVGPLSPITTWLGLPAVVIIPLVFGFLQKDLTGAMLISVLGIEISLALTPLQIYTFGVAATVGIPCIVALGMLAREFGSKRAILLTATSLAYGLLLAGIIWRMISLF